MTPRSRVRAVHLPLELYDWRVDEEIPYLDVSAALGHDGRTLTIGVVNRHADTPIEAELQLSRRVFRLFGQGGRGYRARYSCQ